MTVQNSEGGVDGTGGSIATTCSDSARPQALRVAKLFQILPAAGAPRSLKTMTSSVHTVKDAAERSERGGEGEGALPGRYLCRGGIGRGRR